MDGFSNQLDLAARCQEECWETCLLAACGHGRYMIEQWARSKPPRVEFREGVR
jgi:hypothetical protein